jgi:hypothetical protein
MFVLRQKANTGFLYFVKNGPMGFPKMTSDIGEAHQFPTRDEAEEALTLVAQTFEIFEV